MAQNIGRAKVSRIRAGLLITSSIVLIGVPILFGGRFLVVDAPMRSDCIVVLAGDAGDVRLQRALELLNEGYGKELFIDESSAAKYGRPMYEYAREYASKLPTPIRARVHVCPFVEDSTQSELREISSCLRTILPSSTSALIVTSNFHTRRALSVAKHVLPQYRWSVGAAPDPTFGVRWWEHREWAKTCFTEWEKTIWWQLIEKWNYR